MVNINKEGEVIAHVVGGYCINYPGSILRWQIRDVRVVAHNGCKGDTC